MKRLFGLLIALVTGLAVWAQEADTIHLSTAERAHRRHYLDSLLRLPDFELVYPPSHTLSPPLQPPPAVPIAPYTPHGFVQHPIRLRRVTVLNNLSLQIGGSIRITNGQAWLWSSYPNGYLDARTLSFPLPR